jgi:hypothetical protein
MATHYEGQTVDEVNELTLRNSESSESEWKHAYGYKLEDRDIPPVNKIVVMGPLEVVFFRSTSSKLVVAGEEQEVVDNIKTRFDGKTLVIEQVDHSPRLRWHLRGHIVGSRVIIGIALPEAPSVCIESNGTMTLFDVRQHLLELVVREAGTINVFGLVGHLDAEVSVNGEINAQELVARSAKLLVDDGPGSINAHVSHSVEAHVSGAGSIEILGSPSKRTHSVDGQGSINFPEN